MANVSDYTFNNMSRIGNDNCGLSQKNIQNVEAGNYLLTSFYPQCPMTSAIDLALSQPTMNYSGSHQVGINGCNINANSELTIGQTQTNSKCRISLYERPFATVPYLGRGASHPMLESQLQQGDQVTNRKSITNLSEKSHIPHRETPMVPSLAATVTNPVNLVEGVAAEGWIRGGLPSRDMAKDQQYFGNK
jgi:hypothetical protein